MNIKRLGIDSELPKDTGATGEYSSDVLKITEIAVIATDYLKGHWLIAEFT